MAGNWKPNHTISVAGLLSFAAVVLVPNAVNRTCRLWVRCAAHAGTRERQVTGSPASCWAGVIRELRVAAKLPFKNTHLVYEDTETGSIDRIQQGACFVGLSHNTSI